MAWRTASPLREASQPALASIEASAGIAMESSQEMADPWRTEGP